VPFSTKNFLIVNQFLSPILVTKSKGGSMLYRFISVVLVIVIPFLLNAQDMHNKKNEGHTGHVMKLYSEIEWVEGPPSLPKGAQVAVLEGDPSKEGPFTMRAKIPADYTIAPHTHPAIEHVTVLNGSCYMGMGRNVDESKASHLTAGSFMAIDPGTEHFFYTKEEVEIQLHGIGPWNITYINPADDPRNMTSR
jgi:quercetin dioxygenase-like cupin family protein